MKMSTMATLVAGVVAVHSAVSYGVLINSSTGTGNTTAPVGLPQFNHVGSVNNSTGVYLGDGWVLTANHVGGGSFLLPAVSGTPFTMEAGTGQRLKNADNSFTDLYVFKLTTTPALSTLDIANAPTTSVGINVTLVGNGWNRQNTGTDPLGQGRTYWTDSWTETTVIGDADYAGWKWDTSGQAIRWGTNTTVSIGGNPTGVINGGSGDVTAIATIFDFNGDANEAQAIEHDSGGAVFDSTGKLIGIITNIQTAIGQPASTTVYGNATFAADLGTYYSEIVRTTGIPEPASLGLLTTGLVLFGRRRR